VSAEARADRSTLTLVDGWYAEVPGARSLEDALDETRIARLLPDRLLRLGVADVRSRAAIRGIALFLLSTRYAAVGLARERPGWGTVLFLRALFGRRRKLVVFELIVHERRHPLRKLLYAYDRWAVRRTMLRGHVLTREERETLPRYYGLRPDRFEYVPWPLMTGALPDLPPLPPRPLVLCAGRAYCDWETLFRAARGAGWPLHVLCSERDRGRVEALAATSGAKVETEIPRERFIELMRRATVYVVSLEEKGRSQGHVRLMDGRTQGVPMVVTRTAAVADYVRDDETALVVPPRDPSRMRTAIDRLLRDPDLQERIRRQARDQAWGWTGWHYVRALGEFIAGRRVVLPPEAPGGMAAAATGQQAQQL
jgi:glycosyltransferase involved in cell wall biosynthesis